jgi:hypothetical protein
MSKRVIEFTIAATNKGTFTLPAAVRRIMKISGQGDQLTLQFNPETNVITLRKRQTLDEVRTRNKAHLPKDYKPITDAGEYFLGGGLDEK